MSDKDKEKNLSEVPQEVEEKLREGQVSQARRRLTASTDSWRDALPELPLRFPVKLVRLDSAAATDLLRRSVRSRGRPPLRLEKRDKGIVVVTSRGKKLEVGFLPQSESDMLLDIDPKLRVFRPRLLDIGRDEEGTVTSVAVELLRPELHRCPECGNRHSGTHQLCKKCRKSKKPQANQEVGGLPVPVADAIDAILSEAGDEDLPV